MTWIVVERVFVWLSMLRRLYSNRMNVILRHMHDRQCTYALLSAMYLLLTHALSYYYCGWIIISAVCAESSRNMQTLDGGAVFAEPNSNGHRLEGSQWRRGDCVFLSCVHKVRLIKKLCQRASSGRSRTVADHLLMVWWWRTRSHRACVGTVVICRITLSLFDIWLTHEL